ncbi:MAG: dTDP-4-dehydrorhamnose 3,5-epimerase [Ignavibacteria bacterium]|nr:dTDP-4-dehydrorhamnose 3,5-epimerase [Ignavibacteria bacterium]
MLIEKTFIDGLLLIKPPVFTDERGFFMELYRKDLIEKYINYHFVQDNISCSRKHTLRGLHYQVGKHSQGKLCTVIKGKVLDVAVDIRFGSPTYGKYFSTELSDENKCLLWIPPGFAHGFVVLSDEALFFYKCTAYYNKDSERSIYYADKDLAIDWKVKNPLVSEKDKVAVKFSEIEKDFIYSHQ